MKQLTKSYFELLVEKALISQEKLCQLANLAKEGKKTLDALLLESGISRSDLLAVKSQECGVEFMDLEAKKIDQENARIIPESMCRRYQLICVGKKEETLIVAMADPSDLFALDDLRLRTGYQITALLGYTGDIEQKLDEVFKKEDLEMIMQEALSEKSEEVSVEKNRDKETPEEDVVVDTPIIRFVDKLLIDAINQNSSDIHVEPFENEVEVRYRIDGVLREVMKYPRSIHNPVMSRIKIMADLRLDERRIPQDGRIQIKLGKTRREFDVRISTLPTVMGESVVMRLLDRSGIKIDLQKLGFDDHDYKNLTDLVSHPNGVILVTGPTGSGKSTTLYATLNRLNKPGVKIVTIEDPVEYNLKGIIQVQANASVGLNFATGLRTFLRQDPDIMMVGEIRDKETVMIAIQAALTGHLVLSTLHTNDAITAITRMEDMEVQPFMIASTVRGVLAQRLVRTICQDCKIEQPVSKEEAAMFEHYQVPVPEKIYIGKGCKTCSNSGYKGRIGIYELLVTTEKIREMILNRVFHTEILAEARKNGMKSLLEDGLLKVGKGLTTFEEVYRVTKE